MVWPVDGTVRVQHVSGQNVVHSSCLKGINGSAKLWKPTLGCDLMYICILLSDISSTHNNNPM